MKRIDTPDGRFAAGDPVTRKPGSLVTSTWMNALQDEICNVIEQAGLTLDENDQTQLRTAIGNMISGAIATHNHVIADVTGLQSALNGKLNTSGGTLTNNLTVNGFFIAKATDSKNAVLFLRDSAGNNHGNVFWDRINDRVNLSRYDPETGVTAGWLRINTNNTVQTSHAITAPGFNGKATSADKLHTSPTINGVSFNGTANIITSRWGAERTLTIGNKSRTVNGSANVTWTLADIGAAEASHTHTAAQISDSTAVGRDVLKAADKAAARIAIGAGTSSLKLGTTATTAKAGNWKPDINTDTEGQLPYSRLALPDAFGVGSYALLAADGAAPGDTLPASQLKKSKVVFVMASDYYYDFTLDNEPPVLAGTWRAMGRTPTQVISTRYAPALFMRIA